MKKFLLRLVLTATSLTVFSHTPLVFNYNAVAIDNSGNPIVNAAL